MVLLHVFAAVVSCVALGEKHKQVLPPAQVLCNHLRSANEVLRDGTTHLELQ